MTNLSDFLGATTSRDIGAPSITETVARVTAGAKDDVERAHRQRVSRLILAVVPS